MLLVAQALNQLLHRLRLLVVVQVTLGVQARLDREGAMVWSKEGSGGAGAGRMRWG